MRKTPWELAAWRAVDEHGAVPVILTDGDYAPTVSGTRGGFYTRGGTPIAHPSAYAKKGFSNMVYHTSTRQIHVGAMWLHPAMIDAVRGIVWGLRLAGGGRNGRLIDSAPRHEQSMLDARVIYRTAQAFRFRRAA